MPDVITQEVAAGLLPLRPADGHKGTFGHVFILAGSRGLTGVIRLTCEAAGRAGSGLVTAGIPRALGDTAAATLVEAMSRLLPDTPEHTLAAAAVAPALEFAADKDAVVLGPGISTHRETEQFVQEFVAQCALPMVIDADALNLLARRLTPLQQRPPGTAILTPHPGELSRLAGMDIKAIQQDRSYAAREFAARSQAVVVLKGHKTVIAHPDGATTLNSTGNSGMGTGGTGDVLAGLLGGLLAQGMTPWDAARLGVWLHGCAGDLAAAEFTGRAMLARDVIACLPAAYRKLETGP